MGIVEFLTACLAEDERIARAATAGPWRAHDTHLGQYGYAATILSGEGNDTDLRAWLPSMSNEPWDETRNVWADAAHIAEHDSARVLREIDAKREIVRDFQAALAERDTVEVGADAYHRMVGTVTSLRRVVCGLAAAYSHRPGFKEEWRP